MGRWTSFSSKQEADYLKKIEISWFNRNKYLIGYRYGSMSWSMGGEKTGSISFEVCIADKEFDDYIKLQYTITDDEGKKKEFDYKVMLTTTACHFGGERYWFICPLYKNGIYCGRRAGVLYLSSGYFGCRHCQNLTYSSQKENRNYRFYPFGQVLKIENKIDELEKEIKRPSYGGKSTRKQKQINQLYQQKLDNVVLLTKNKML